MVAAAAALVATLLFRLTTIAPDTYDLGERQLTAFIAQPDALGAAVAVLAGVIGMLSLTEARSGALVGVLVSVTTIPALGNIGVATAYGAWEDVGGAALQLTINITGARRRRRRHAPRPGPHDDASPAAGPPTSRRAVTRPPGRTIPPWTTGRWPSWPSRCST